ncbi:MAG TPA: hypothetical protein VM389_04370, partial [Phycisphaerae bacterium]|nr:hypothetical protein [Phycisphaerae bacterium]
MTMSTATNLTATVPDPILRTLKRLVRRARLVIALRGTCAVLAAAIAALLTVMAIDAVAVIRSDWPRWALSLAGLAVTLLSLLWFLVRPLARSFTMAGIARAIEGRHPELHERISSAIELLSSKDAPELRGSDALIAALAAEASRDARGVHIRHEVPLRSARPFLIAAAVVAVILVGLFIATPQATSQLVRRALAPYRNYANVHAGQLTVSPGDQVLAVGDRLAVEVLVANKAVPATYFLRSGGGGGETSVEMTALPSRDRNVLRFAYTTPPAESSFQYRVEAGRALTRRYNVTVVPRPAVVRREILYEYPEYTHRPSSLERDAVGDIHAVAGSRVVLTAETNTPVTAAEMLVNDRSFAQGQLLSTQDGSEGATRSVFRFDLTPDLRGSYQIRLTKRVQGTTFTASTEPRRIEAAPDAMPLVKITSPDRTTLKLKPDDRLPIFYAASDYFGLSAVELLVSVDGVKLPPRILPLNGRPDGPALAAAGKTILDLKAMDVESTQRVTFQLRAVDTLPDRLGGPQEAFSKLFTVEAQVDAETYARQFTLAEELLLREVLEAVLKDLLEAKKHSGPLQKALQKVATAKKSAPLSETNGKRIDAMHERLSAADAALRDLIQQLSGGTYAAIATKLTGLADAHVDKADSVVGQIKLVEDPQVRADLADEADFQIDR